MCIRDRILFEHLSCIELHKVYLNGKKSEFIEKGMVKDYDLSPDQDYLLIKKIKRPFSYLVPYYRFPYIVKTIDLNNKQEKTIADIPVDEVRPIGFDATREGIRSVSWRNDKESELYWVEANDNGDPKVESDGRDIVYTLKSPFNDKKDELLRTNLRYSNISWGSGNYAILTERLWKNRNEVTSLVNVKDLSLIHI